MKNCFHSCNFISWPIFYHVFHLTQIWFERDLVIIFSVSSDNVEASLVSTVSRRWHEPTHVQIDGRVEKLLEVGIRIRKLGVGGDYFKKLLMF